MANLKISGLNTENNLSNVLGLAGYNSSGTIKISGNEIIADVTSSILPVTLNSGNGEVTGVLSASNGGTGVGSLNDGRLVVGGGSNALSTITSQGKGKLVVGRTVGGVDSTGIVSVGTDGQVLIANSAITEYGIEWGDVPTPTLDDVMEQGSISSVTNSEIRLRTTAASGQARLEATGSSGQVILTANNTGGDISLTCNDRMNFTAGQYWFGGGTAYNFTNDFNIDLYNYMAGTNPGNFRVIAKNDAGIYTGNPGTTTGGGDITLQARSGDLLLKTVTGTLGTGEMKIQLAASTPAVGHVLTAKDTAGSLQWEAPDAAKAFVTLPAGANASWTVKTNYNATWNIGSGSVTLSITASPGDSGTLVVTSTTGDITWPTNSNWPDATEPTLTANGTDIFSFLYDGTNYYWTFGQNFGA